MKNRNSLFIIEGFSGVNGYDYLDFGSADGCPQYSDNNGSCNNGWNQYDEWYVSWGATPALPTPEIYYDALARQWAMISLYGAQYQHAVVYMQGPWLPRTPDSGNDLYSEKKGTILDGTLAWLYTLIPYCIERWRD
ncbi:MAG TPA: hypothetical protein VKR42_00275 [Ktedonobacteraceae bacterium]|nr:hypothetical protein [Ktedonobacteraceae bacterium]